MISLYKAFKGLYKLCECNCGYLIKCINSRGELARFKIHHNFNKNGILHHNYKNGRSKMSNNYYMIRIPGYFSTDKDGRIYEHVYFYQEHNKCCLLPWGEIHHIEPVTEDYCNNMPWNLMGMTKGQHSSLTNTTDHSNTRCKICNSDKTSIRKHDRLRKTDRPRWYNYKDGYICDSCYNREYRKRKKVKS